MPRRHWYLWIFFSKCTHGTLVFCMGGDRQWRLLGLGWRLFFTFPCNFPFNSFGFLYPVPANICVAAVVFGFQVSPFHGVYFSMLHYFVLGCSKFYVVYLATWFVMSVISFRVVRSWCVGHTSSVHSGVFSCVPCLVCSPTFFFLVLCGNSTIRVAYSATDRTPLLVWYCLGYQFL